MNQNQIDKKIMEFIGNTLSDKDFLWLEDWLKEKKNRTYFDAFLKINYLLNINKPFNRQSSLEKIKTKIEFKSNNKKSSLYLKYSAIAASIAILITVGIWFTKINTSDSQFTTPIIVRNQIKSGTNKATLTLENGEEVTLVKGDLIRMSNAISNGEEIIYKSGKHINTEIVFNYLTVPRGGQFQLRLEDGTQVWLNSESQLKYPVAFTEGNTRQVELVYGEAYFDVSPSTEHKGAKFKVVNNSQEVEVLGTEFNIKAYIDESNIYTTLVEGRVKVTNPYFKQVLEPNQQSNLDKINNEVSVEVVDAKSEIAWIHGDFVFRHKPLKDIMKVLTRWYDVDIVIQNKSLEDAKFNGELSKYQNLEEILLLIKNTNYINEYEIRNKKIILK